MNIRIAVKMCNGIITGSHKIVWIKNTMEIREIMVTDTQLEDVKANPTLEIITDTEEMKFDKE